MLQGFVCVICNNVNYVCIFVHVDKRVVDLLPSLRRMSIKKNAIGFNIEIVGRECPEILMERGYSF